MNDQSSLCWYFHLPSPTHFLGAWLLCNIVQSEVLVSLLSTDEAGRCCSVQTRCIHELTQTTQTTLIHAHPRSILHIVCLFVSLLSFWCQWWWVSYAFEIEFLVLRVKAVCDLGVFSICQFCSMSRLACHYFLGGCYVPLSNRRTSQVKLLLYQLTSNYWHFFADTMAFRWLFNNEIFLVSMNTDRLLLACND